MYWEESKECIARPDLEQLQLERLQSTLYRVYKNVPLYRSRFKAMRFNPEDIRSLDDLRSLPFTTKADIRENYPYGLFAVPLREVVRLQASSGTTGKPTVVGYTRNDIRRWADLMSRVLTAAGVTRDDVVQIAFGYGLFTGGFGFDYGAENLGASVIPSSNESPRRQVLIMQDYRTSTLVSTPSYALHLADTMAEMDVNVNALTLKRGIFGAETWSEAMRREIQDRLKIQAMDAYGVSEVMGPGIAGECEQQNGLHINEDHFIAEIIDPDTGEPLESGREGELVLTSLTKEAFPMIRFRTGDLTRLNNDRCACGRTLARMSRVRGRTDDMIIVRGINVFPSQIEPILFEVEGTEPHYQIVLEREGSLDTATLNVEVNESILSDRITEAQRVVEEIESRLAAEFGIPFKVRLVEKQSLGRSEGKGWNVEDRRSFE
ncbi:MAG: phenylacetate--CoA ligase family protein [Desulfovibrionales bacterium]